MTNPTPTRRVTSGPRDSRWSGRRAAVLSRSFRASLVTAEQSSTFDGGGNGCGCPYRDSWPLLVV